MLAVTLQRHARVESSYVIVRPATDQSGKALKLCGVLRSLLHSGPGRPAFLLGSPAFRFVLTILLSFSMGAAGYLLGVRRQRNPASGEIRSDHSQAALRAQLGSAIQERDLLDARVKEHSEAVDRLNAKIARQLEDISHLRKLAEESQAEKGREASAVSQLQDENSVLRADRDNTAQGLQDAQKSLAELKQQLHRLQSERVAGLLERASVQT